MVQLDTRLIGRWKEKSDKFELVFEQVFCENTLEFPSLQLFQMLSVGHLYVDSKIFALWSTYSNGDKQIIELVQGTLLKQVQRYTYSIHDGKLQWCGTDGCEVATLLKKNM